MAEVRLKRPANADGSGPKRITVKNPVVKLTDQFEDVNPVAGTFEIAAKSDNRVGGRLTPKEIGEQLSKPAKIASIRAYRNSVNTVLRWSMLGLMPPEHAKIIVNIAKTGAELLMTEKIMEAAGQLDQEPQHPDAEEHTIHPPGRMPTAARTVRVIREIGVGPDGNPIDKTTAEIEGGEDLAGMVPALGSVDAEQEG